MSLIPSLTPDYLSEHLDSAFLDGGKILSVIPGDMAESLIRFEVVFSSDTPDSVPRHYLIKTNLKGYPHALTDARFYRDIAPMLEDPPIPRTFDVRVDEEQGGCALLQVDLGPTHVTALNENRDPTFDHIAEVIDRIARIHAVCWDKPFINDELFVTSREDICDLAQVGYPENLVASCNKIPGDRLQRMINLSPEGLPEGWADDCRRAITSFPELARSRYAGRNLTLIHADLHPGNILVPANGENNPAIIDWELLCRGLGVYDISYLIIRCCLPSSERKEMEPHLIDRYHQKLVENSVEDYSREACIEDYRLSIIPNLLPPLAWRRFRNLKASFEAFYDWDCLELLT